MDSDGSFFAPNLAYGTTLVFRVEDEAEEPQIIEHSALSLFVEDPRKLPSEDWKPFNIQNRENEDEHSVIMICLRTLAYIQGMEVDLVFSRDPQTKDIVYEQILGIQYTVTDENREKHQRYKKGFQISARKRGMLDSAKKRSRAHKVANAEHTVFVQPPASQPEEPTVIIVSSEIMTSESEVPLQTQVAEREEALKEEIGDERLYGMAKTLMLVREAVGLDLQREDRMPVTVGSVEEAQAYIAEHPDTVFRVIAPGSEEMELMREGAEKLEQSPLGPIEWCTQCGVDERENSSEEGLCAFCTRAKNL